LGLGLALFFMAIIFFAVLFGFGYALSSGLRTVSDDSKEETDHDRHQLIAEYDERFEKINSQVLNVIAIDSGQIYWSRLFENISREAAPGIKITTLSTKDYAVFMTGEADSRDDLISFKEKLEKNSCFAEIILPLSNLVSKENIAFQMDLKVRENCVKNK